MGPNLISTAKYFNGRMLSDYLDLCDLGPGVLVSSRFSYQSCKMESGLRLKGGAP